jgi:cold shock CspA family protein
VQRVYAERGFGFIRAAEGPDSGQDFFFHMSGLDDCRIDELEEGSLVEFEARTVAKGRRAEHVCRELGTP